MVVVNIVYTIHLNVCLTLQSEKTQSFITVIIIEKRTFYIVLKERNIALKNKHSINNK